MPTHGVTIFDIMLGRVDVFMTDSSRKYRYEKCKTGTFTALGNQRRS